jgi:hypothetical protein
LLAASTGHVFEPQTHVMHWLHMSCLPAN